MARGSATAVRGAVSVTCTMTDLGRPGVIVSGICFLDHMLDQLVSHGQLGVELRATVDGVDAQAHCDYVTRTRGLQADETATQVERPHDHALFQAAGEAVGAALARMATAATAASAAGGAASGGEAGGGAASVSVGSSHFAAPLDEAVTVAEVGLGPASVASCSTDGAGCAEKGGNGYACALAPYGDVPSGVGRLWVGLFRCALAPVFFEALHAAMAAECGGARLALRKARGRNGHHVLEATFKSFARALRKHLDARAAAAVAAAGTTALAGTATATAAATVGAARVGARARQTKETHISISVCLDPDWSGSPTEAEASPEAAGPRQGRVTVTTGVAMLDALVTEFATHARIGCYVTCNGDCHIDDHHTAEDVAIALGAALADALGDKAGCNRMGSAAARVGGGGAPAPAAARGAAGGGGALGVAAVGATAVEAEGAVVSAVVDLSNRPCYASDLAWPSEWAGGMAAEMVEHVFESLTVHMRATVHLVHTSAAAHAASAAEPAADAAAADAGGGGGADGRALALAAARALGAALAQCAAVDPRRAGATASSKGTLNA